jgi:hypothetical protein
VVDAAEKAQNDATLAAGVRVEIKPHELMTKGRSFILDEKLWVVALDEGGQAQELGITKGMRLIGFQEELIQHTVNWTRLKSYAATQAFPHVFTFGQPSEEAGSAAVAAYEQARATEAEAVVAKEAARQVRMAEIVDALEVLTADTDAPAPEKQQTAILRVGSTASLGTSELVAGWLYQRLISSQALPAVQLKSMALITSLLEGGSLALQGCLVQRCAAAVSGSTAFECEPHPELGDKPQRLVR